MRASAPLFVAYADWSPNAAWLAFVAGNEAQTEFALYLAQADGAQLQRALLDGLPQSLQWTADSKSVVVTTTLNRYLMDVSSGQLQATPISTVTPTPSPSATTTLTPTPTP
jgi:Tol biopolymer transport system component